MYNFKDIEKKWQDKWEKNLLKQLIFILQSQNIMPI